MDLWPIGLHRVQSSVSLQHLRSILGSCFTYKYDYSLTQTGQKTGKAGERREVVTEGLRKEEGDTVSC